VTARAISRLHAFAFAGTMVVVATVLRFAADPWLGRSVPYLLFYPAIVIAAAYGGFWPGALATGLSGIVAVVFYLEPIHRLTLTGYGDTLAFALFVVNGALISRVSEIARRGTFSQQQLAAIVQSSDDAIVAKDLDAVITSWNGGAERIFGYSAAEAVGCSIRLIIPPECLDEEERVLARVRAGQRVEPFETVRRRKDGTHVDVSIAISPIKDAEGIVVGASKIARDISERRHEERLRGDLTERERLAREDALVARDRLAFLAEVGAVLASSLDYSETLDRAVHLALPRLGDYCNVFIEEERDRLRHVAWGHVDRAKEPVLRELAARLVEGAGSSSVAFANTVMKTGKNIVVSHDVLVRPPPASPPSTRRS
jgi:PAS domain S-box-containing protein